MPGQIKNLLGMSFGQLKVVAFAGVWHGRAYWCCECKCKPGCKECQGAGCRVKVAGKNMISGHTKSNHPTRSCGCSRTDADAKKAAWLRTPKELVRKRAEAAKKANTGKTPTPAYSLTLDRAALLLGLSRERIENLCGTGILNSRRDKKSGYLMVSARDVEAYAVLNSGTPERCEVGKK